MMWICSCHTTGEKGSRDKAPQQQHTRTLATVPKVGMPILFCDSPS